MPVEIKELVVRAEVVNNSADARATDCAPDSPAARLRERQTLAAATAASVLAVLKSRRER